ncbi:glycosyltransferase family 4 protein [Polynucleobacter sp. Latsch14-2]|jgi:glycosyltransferase involved in cell wall biosynthesis|uniref:glycosyltransferase family 4 protein n=1 Tax=Polynucleobacter sp. Latsch14-2 TaxID=2576920 RepID=UPI001C0D71CE|nr:glycosyltransferase family 1 protein [Polynucleobacter sp. Latsch14-2]MBU3615461.1 glycosyltransferase family 4 protein [Polynucleobacter sp. Latsch14-2]
MKKNLFIDVDDYIKYLLGNVSVSGIQRVQYSILKALEIDKSSNIYCFSIQNRKITLFGLSELVEWTEIGDVDERNKAFIELKKNASEITIFDALKSQIGNSENILLLTGAPWNTVDYYQIISFFKNTLNARVVQLIHDLIPLKHPEYFDEDLVKNTEEYFLQSTKLIDHFWTVSNKTKEDMKFLFKYSNAIPDTQVLLNISPFKSASHSRVKSTTGKDKKPFVLFVGTVERRKNHEFIARVWRSLVKKDPLGTPDLICVGKKGWKSDDFYKIVTGDTALRSKVKVLTGVNDDALVQLYKDCEYTVYPALEEGFGLPVAESLSMGKVCVVGTCPSLREASQNLAFVANEYDTTEWVDTLFKLNNTPTILRKKEIEISKKFKFSGYDSYLKSIKNLVSKISHKTKNSYQTFPENLELVFAPARIEDHSRALEAYKLPISNAIGTDANFLPNFDGLSFGDWNEGEEWGRWGKFPMSTVSFSLGILAAGKPIYLILRANSNPALENANLRIYVNSVGVWAGKLSAEPMNIIFKVPQGIIGKQNQITFFYNPKEVDMGALKALDPRLLGIGLRAMMILDPEDSKNLHFFFDMMIKGGNVPSGNIGI